MSAVIAFPLETVKKVLQRKGKIVNVRRVYDMRTLFALLLYADPDGAGTERTSRRDSADLPDPRAT